MKTGINARDLKEQVSLTDLLSRLGYQPLRRSGKEHIYLSMLRDSDTKPSFCVNESLNVWYDHGTGRGGNLIDFGMAYWQLPFKEAIGKIGEVIGQVLTVPLSPKVERRHAHKLPHYQVEDIRELGSNEAIIAYLNDRGLWQIGQNWLKEVYINPSHSFPAVMTGYLFSRVILITSAGLPKTALRLTASSC